MTMTMTMATIQVKARYGDDVRRFALEKTDEGAYVALRRVLCNTYGISSFLAKYVDDENDEVTISSDEDLDLACDICKNTLRVLVVPMAPQDESDESDQDLVCVRPEEDEDMDAPAGVADDEALVAEIPIPTPIVPAAVASETCKIAFRTKRGVVVELQVNKALFSTLGFDTLDASALDDALATWRLGDLVRVGLVSVEEATKVCVQHGLKVPPICRAHGRGRGRGRGRCAGKAMHPYHRHGHGRHGHGEHAHGHHGHHGHGHHGHHAHHGHGHQGRHAHGPHGHGPHGHGPHGHGPHGHGPHGHGPHGHGPHCHGRHGRGHHASHVHAQLGSTPPVQSFESISLADRPFKEERNAPARLIKDVTVPEGHVVRPCENLVKTWRVRNDSSTPWPEKCELVATGGDIAGFGHTHGSTIPLVGGLAPGQERDVTIGVVMCAEAAAKRAAFWRIREVGGQKFGQKLWIRVAGSAST